MPSLCLGSDYGSATLFVDFMELPLNVIYYSLPGDIRLERDEDGLVCIIFSPLLTTVDQICFWPKLGTKY